MKGIYRVGVVTLFALIVLSIQSSTITAKVMKQEQRRMVGGYNTVGTDDEEVIKASELVLNNLKLGKVPDGYSLDFSEGTFSAKVLSASQQVVAGMNYKLKLGFFRNGLSCIGGMETIVYRDLQGIFIVSSYGKEITCDDVDLLLKKAEDEE